jgi:hypothetical protein
MIGYAQLDYAVDLPAVNLENQRFYLFFRPQYTLDKDQRAGLLAVLETTSLDSRGHFSRKEH